MGAFAYRAMDAAGKENKGVLEGDTPKQIRQLLRERGLVPLEVEAVQQKEQRQQSSQMSFMRGLSSADLAMLTRQLATLVGSGTPVEESLRAVSQQTSKPRVANMMMGVRSKVLEGHPLATAFGDYPHVFNELFRSTVQAGEQAGHLENVLDRLADYTEARQQMQSKMMVALLYPSIITVVAVGVIALLLAFVVPQVTEMFDRMGQELPLPTQILIAVSDFLGNFGIYLLVLLGIAITIFLWLLKKEPVRYRFDGFVLRMPLLGKLVRGLNTARFARTFSILASSGVPVLEAMRISAQVTTNLPMREAVNDAARRVREGASISKSLDNSKLFPPMIVHLIGSGESSGNLEEMLDRSADSQEREIETFISALLGLFEPIMILVMGGAVMFIVLAILLPILNMNTLLQ